MASLTSLTLPEYSEYFVSNYRLQVRYLFDIHFLPSNLKFSIQLVHLLGASSHVAQN